MVGCDHARRERIRGLLEQEDLQVQVCDDARALLDGDPPALVVCGLRGQSVDARRLGHLLRSRSWVRFRDVPLLVVIGGSEMRELSGIRASVPARTFVASLTEPGQFSRTVRAMLAGEPPEQALRLLVVGNLNPSATEQFRARGWRCDRADDAQAAFAWFERRRSYDVTLLDDSLDEVRNGTLARTLRSRDVSRVIVVLWESPTAEQTLSCTEAGASACLDKPLDPDTLVQTCLRLVREHALTARAIDDQSEMDGPFEGAQKYRSLFEQSIDGIFVHDLDGRILDVNRAAAEQQGCEQDALVGMCVFDLIVGESPAGISEQWRAWRPGQSFIFENEHWRRDGTKHPVEINTGKVVIGDRELMLAIVRDISERRHAEQEKARLERQLQHALKMEAVGRLAGGLAHDFNNVLCAIMGNAELTLARLDADDPLRGAIRPIVEAADRAGNLTRQLLAFSRKHVAEPKVVEVSHMVEALHPMLARLLGEDVMLQTVSPAGLGGIRIDPGELEQIVLNLAVNARDAMPKGGQLVIETARVTLDDVYVSMHVGAKAGDFILIAVSDTGIGMDAETRSKVFEPFFTTKPTGEGTGLGLATVYGIVKQRGGHVEVYSELGQGTTFKLYFPRVSEVPERADREEPTVPAGGHETILLVEDDSAVREVAVKFLARCGYEVLVAADGEDALALAECCTHPADLLLTDVVMPKMNGRELAIRLTGRWPGLKVLYTSGYTRNVLGRHGVLDEGLHFIAKPYTFHSLAARVRDVLDCEPSAEVSVQRGS